MEEKELSRQETVAADNNQNSSNEGVLRLEVNIKFIEWICHECLKRKISDAIEPMKGHSFFHFSLFFLYFFPAVTPCSRRRASWRS